MKLFDGLLARSIPELFDSASLERLRTDQSYQTASPFPHIVVDGLFNPSALQSILREWPVQNEKSGEMHDDGLYSKKKFATTWKTDFGACTKEYLHRLANPAFLQVLQDLTGIRGLMPDPYLFGGGLHATAAGGKLAVHADYNKHPITKLDRRLNLLVYLNREWNDDNAGWLELWDRNMTACEKRVLPVFNRTVIFSTTSTSYHGQPEPIVGPASLWRKSLALYYFSNGRPEESTAVSDEHSTLWQERPTKGY